MKFLQKIISFTKEYDNCLNNEKEYFDVNIAKENYNTYLKRQEQRRKDYIYELEDEIKEASLDGKLSIVTYNTHCDFISYDYLDELKRIFENKGFTVTKECSNSGLLTDWLRISWE